MTLEWHTILFLTTGGLFLLPLLPGIIEIIRRTDVKPLRVSQDYDTNPMHFAEGFRRFIAKHFAHLTSGETRDGQLVDGTKFQIVGSTGVPVLGGGSAHTKLVLSEHAMTLPADSVFESEVYGAQEIATGDRSQFRAILAERTLQFREYNTVLRWAHSTGEMLVGKHAILLGRATSNQGIILNDDVQFERLHAPIIMTNARNRLAESNPPSAPTVLNTLPDVRVQSKRRWLLYGHLDFPENHVFDGDIVTGTTATIGDYAHIKGSVKCNAHADIKHFLPFSGNVKRGVGVFRVGKHVRIDGSIFSSHDLIIGEGCRITGPIVANNQLIIGAGTIIGSPTHPTTVTAPHIIIEPGCTIYGTLWATVGGKVQYAGVSGAAA